MPRIADIIATPRAARVPPALAFWQEEAEGFEKRLIDVLAALDEAGVDPDDKLEEGDAVRAIASLAREAPAAKRERALITELIGAGKSKSQIEDALVKQYGEQVLATPRSNGFDLWAWLIPAGLILLAAVGLFALINSWRRGPADEPIAEPVQPLDDADAARVDAELRARD
jgi:cytochrome c-type biogenesis protein CcmH/NrfF